MRIIGLLSGGKDSLFAVGKALEQGHELVCVANLYAKAEADSFMFQTAGTNCLAALAQALDVPLVSRALTLASVNTELNYTFTQQDEVEDLYNLLYAVKLKFPQAEAVVSGAVLSSYQRNRVENVCGRLGLVSISPLWKYDQMQMLNEMTEKGYKAVICKISAMGLLEKHLGQNVFGYISQFAELKSKYGFHVAGEGGEYETLVVDAPIMKKRLILEETEVVSTGNSVYSPYGYLVVNKVKLQDKETEELQEVSAASQTLPSVYFQSGDFYTSEVTVSSLGLEGRNIQDETFTVLDSIKTAIQAKGLSMNEIYYLTAYIQDMSLYQEFNSVYVKFFDFPNPPSRVCCEVNNQTNRVKVSVKGTTSTKKCTHVQSISSWAPANIGPYSQAYKVLNNLHLAGSIPLIPETMQLSQEAFPQILKNCQAIAESNDFKLEAASVCYAYYTTQIPEIPPTYNPFPVKVSNLPKNSQLELEFHLEQNCPPFEAFEQEVSGTGFSAKLRRRESYELVDLIWYISIHQLERPENLLEHLQGLLEEYFSKVKHKSPISKEELLGEKETVYDIMNYICDLRVYGQDPYSLKQGWLERVPSTFVNSETNGVVIVAQDSLQLYTYQFIYYENN